MTQTVSDYRYLNLMTYDCLNLQSLFNPNPGEISDDASCNFCSYRRAPSSGELQVFYIMSNTSLYPGMKSDLKLAFFASVELKFLNKKERKERKNPTKSKLSREMFFTLISS